MSENNNSNNKKIALVMGANKGTEVRQRAVPGAFAESNRRWDSLLKHRLVAGN